MATTSTTKTGPAQRGSNPPIAKSDQKAYTAFRCPVDLMQKAKALAKRDRRSFSNYLINLLAREVEAANL